MEIGTRCRVSNTTPGMAPSTRTDVHVEGWTETGASEQYTFALDTSPADTPARLILDDATYGRLAAASDCALNAAITAVATTVVIKTPTAPGFTLVAGAYPMDVSVGAEIITLNSVPGGSTSPQTFTGVTRGAKGSTAAAQVINATVQVWPLPTLTL
jgi:hypothetical protein